MFYPPPTVVLLARPRSLRRRRQHAPPRSVLPCESTNGLPSSLVHDVLHAAHGPSAASLRGVWRPSRTRLGGSQDVVERNATLPWATREPCCTRIHQRPTTKSHAWPGKPPTSERPGPVCQDKHGPLDVVSHLRPAMEVEGVGDVATVDESDVRAEHIDRSGHARAPATSRRRARPRASSGPCSAEVLKPSWADITAGQPPKQPPLERAYYEAIRTRENTDRTLRLLRLVLGAVVTIVLATAVILGIFLSDGAGWSLVSGLGLAVGCGAGTLVRARRRRSTPPSLQLPTPRAGP